MTRIHVECVNGCLFANFAVLTIFQGHTAISTSTFYSVPKERPKRFVHANLLDVIDPNESDFSADEKKVTKKCLETAVMKEMPSKLR